MKLNSLEFAAMNSPIRAYIQEHYEIPMLRAMASGRAPAIALEIGCGNGSGTRLIKKYFSPGRIIGIDLDEKMIGIAGRRNRDPSISFKVMDASKLGFPDGRFDTVFDFGIIHHIPNWRDALREIARVLKPGGELILEDLSIATFSTGIGRLWRMLSDHPYDSMYSPAQFTEFLGDIGFTLGNYRESNPLGLIKFFSLTAIRGKPTVLP